MDVKMRSYLLVIKRWFVCENFWFFLQYSFAYAQTVDLEKSSQDINQVIPDNINNDTFNEISIWGQGFEPEMKVNIIGDKSLDVLSVTSDKLTVKIPPFLSPGKYDLQVQWPSGQFLCTRLTIVSESCDLESIYFDFNKWNLGEDAGSSLEHNIKCLRANGITQVKIYGYADERGEIPYNQALSAQRALTVKQHIINSKKIEYFQAELFSFGELAPQEIGHNETAWQRNRRVDIRADPLGCPELTVQFKRNSTELTEQAKKNLGTLSQCLRYKKNEVMIFGANDTVEIVPSYEQSEQQQSDFVNDPFQIAHERSHKVKQFLMQNVPDLKASDLVWIPSDLDETIIYLGTAVVAPLPNETVPAPSPGNFFIGACPMTSETVASYEKEPTGENTHPSFGNENIPPTMPSRAEGKRNTNKYSMIYLFSSVFTPLNRELPTLAPLPGIGLGWNIANWPIPYLSFWASASGHGFLGGYTAIQAIKEHLHGRAVFGDLGIGFWIHQTYFDFGFGPEIQGTYLMRKLVLGPIEPMEEVFAAGFGGSVYVRINLTPKASIGLHPQVLLIPLQISGEEYWIPFGLIQAGLTMRWPRDISLQRDRKAEQ